MVTENGTGVPYQAPLIIESISIEAQRPSTPDMAREDTRRLMFLGKRGSLHHPEALVRIVK